jgi:hypothetical protein
MKLFFNPVTMKKALISLFAILTLTMFTACGEDQQPAQTPAETDDEQIEQIDSEEIETPGAIEIPEITEDSEEIENSEDPEEVDNNNEDEEETPTEDDDDEEFPPNGGDYIGTWSSVSTTLDGELLDVSTNIVVMTADRYTSTTSYCSIGGDLVITDDTLDVFVDTNTCPVPANDAVMTYKVSEDEETLTLISTEYGATMVDTLMRIDDEEDEDYEDTDDED